MRSPSDRGPRNAVRIIGGAWKRSLIRFPELPELRPTPDRVRETVFNWLGQDLAGLRCLDLFAGSGALGFEAASRGAAEVTLVETNLKAHAALLENARRLDAPAVRVEKIDAIEFLSRGETRFDVVFLDPPFRRGVDDQLLARVAGRLADRACVYLESELPFNAPDGWTTFKQARAGKVNYQLMRRSGEFQ